MRKYVVGIVIGVLLASAFPVSAAVTSLVGKKITNEYTITVDGKDIGVKAIVVDGVSYTPNRAIVGAMGGDVKFLNKTVVVTTDAQQSGGEEVPSNEMTEKERNNKLSSIIGQIEIIQSKIHFNQQKLRSDPNDAETQELIETLQSQLAELERQKAALEAQN